MPGLAMIIVNTLAQLLPINGVTPGQLSDALPHLFAPASLILIKHTSATAFADAYSAVIWTVAACLAIYAVAEAYLITKILKNRGKRVP